MNNLEKKYTVVNEKDLVEIDGGIGIVAGALIVGGVIFGSGVFVGYTEAKKGK